MQAKEVRKININVVDACTGEAIGAAVIKLWVNGSHVPYEGLSYNGKYQFCIDDMGLY